MKNLLTGFGIAAGLFVFWSIANGGADPDCGYDCEVSTKTMSRQEMLMTAAKAANEKTFACVEESKAVFARNNMQVTREIELEMYRECY